MACFHNSKKLINIVLFIIVNMLLNVYGVKHKSLGTAVLSSNYYEKVLYNSDNG